MRYFLEIAYNGTRYNGWQIQENAHSVQAELNTALSTILRQPIDTLGSSRTDTGVHCKQQFVHFDTAEPIADIERLLYRLFRLLPPDLHVSRLLPMPAQAHSRFDALSRSYEYHVMRKKNPFLENLALLYTYSLNIELMNEASKILLEHTDFEAFSKVKTNVNNFLCHITEAKWVVENEEKWVFHITANRFLRSMVRTIVGTLLEIGHGGGDVLNFEQIILSRDRRKAGKSIPPYGLYLAEVRYPEGYFEKKI